MSLLREVERTRLDPYGIRPDGPWCRLYLREVRQAMTAPSGDGERCVWCFLFDNGFALRIPPHEFLGFQPSQSASGKGADAGSPPHHPATGNGVTAPKLADSLSARETAEVRTNPASGDRPDTVTHTPGLGTSASKRADTLLPLWCLPALVPP